MIRYVVTHIGRSGVRTLAQAAQGQYTYETREEAQAQLDAMLTNNAAVQLHELFGFPLEVRPCECWPGHHDPKGIYFD